MKPGIEVDCRLEVIGDLVALRRHTRASRRSIVAAINELLPSLNEFVALLDDSDDAGGDLPGKVGVDVRLLTS